MTVSQERLLKDTSDRLQVVEKELESTHKQLLTKDEQVRPTRPVPRHHRALGRFSC